MAHVRDTILQKREYTFWLSPGEEDTNNGKLPKGQDASRSSHESNDGDGKLPKGKGKSRTNTVGQTMEKIRRPKNESNDGDGKLPKGQDKTRPNKMSNDGENTRSFKRKRIAS